MYKIVLIRHGQSTWNKENKFTGWTDVDLSDNGVKEAKDAARLLKKDKYSFDLAFTSVLKRATKTLKIILKEMNLDIPIKYSWRLNERHYGSLQGLNKAEMADKVGEEKVQIWRRSYDVKPPLLSTDDSRFPGKDELYSNVDTKDLPLGESLKDTVSRVMPYWNENIVPAIKAGDKIIISAHGNSLRALVKYLDNVSDLEISRLNIPTGIPLVYELDSELRPLKHYYLGDQQKVNNAINSVKNQVKTN